MKTKMCGAKEVVINGQNSINNKNNNNKIDLSPSVEQHHKHNQSNKDKQ